MTHDRKKPVLSGTALEMMTPGIEFGPVRTLEVIDAIYKAASEHPDKKGPIPGISPDVTPVDIIEAIDTFFPKDGEARSISDRLDFSKAFETNPLDRPLWIMAQIQNHVWMQQEGVNFLHQSPLDTWHALQYAEYVALYKPLEDQPDRTKMISFDGVVFERKDDRIQIHSLHDKPQGDLIELKSTKAVLPQFYAILDDGQLQDLRNDNYSIVEDEPEAEEDDGLSM